MTVQTHGIEVVEGDLSHDFEAAIKQAAVVAWDIETSGLDWGLDAIATCQLHVEGFGTQVVRINSQQPERLRNLLQSDLVLKIFHHAPFDLCFMTHHWHVVARNVACTKALSKILRPGSPDQVHSLQPTVKCFLGIALDKSQQTSNWMSTTLTDEQIAYAAHDVEYLIPLLNTLMSKAQAIGVADLALRTFAYLPTRVETDIRGCGDVFAY